MKMPKSYWPEYAALALFVAGPVYMLVASIVSLIESKLP